jgi:hypothetical protein
MEKWRHEDIETWRHGDMENGDMENGDMETWRQGHGDMVMETAQCTGDMELKYWGILTFYKNKSNGKRKPRRFPLFRLQFAHHANGSLSFVRLLIKKQTEVIRLQTD